LIEDSILYIFAGVATTTIVGVGGFVVNSQVKLAKIIQKLDLHIEESKKYMKMVIDVEKRVTILECA